MPSALIRLGLTSAIKDLANKINESKKIKVAVKIQGLKKRINENVEIAIYRIVQEIMNNIINHSEADNVNIVLIKENSNLHLIIKDNGIGLDKSIIKKSEGIGWKNIYSRISMLNGNIAIDSVKDKGTEISIKFAHCLDN